jgi:bifunctional non-homologous end joining protein LigD
MADAGHRSKGSTRLKRYVAKRDFTKTAEPSHKASAVRGKKLTFVVQKHAARRLHWDFRLEWEGTLRSWAVPKGPSLDPADKRLAVEVEDHPLAYAKFEGDIPKGQYGGGHVDIWDNGTWEPVGDFNKGLKKGHLEFEMFGKKLSGRWHLVRHAHAGQTTQLVADEERRLSPRARARTADVIDAGGADDTKRLLRPRTRAKSDFTPVPKPGGAPKPRSRKTSGTRGSALPSTLKPQLATLVDKVPGDGGWVYELKYDGVRLLCRVDGADVRCISRNGLDWTHKVGPIVDALAKLSWTGPGSMASSS